MKKEEKGKKIENKPADMQGDTSIIVDPDGSWTGVAIDGDKPIQDVDDL